MRSMYYANGTLDRSANSRRDTAWLKDRLDHAATRIVAYWQGKPLVNDTEDRLSAWTLSYSTIDSAAEPILLGVIDDIAYFAIELAGEAAPQIELPATALFQELRAASARLSAADAAMLAYGKAMIYWHGRQRFCGICGQPTRSVDAGHVRRCTGCQTNHFPRTDAAVIMLVTDGDRALMGRQANWPTGMYSVLAGFVEPGESLEAAVAREVLEEAGLEIANCRYFASQPWPFPGSLMLGFRADAVTTEIRIDATELEDARWVSRAWLKSNVESDSFRMPPSGAIARAMVDEWLEES